jgi:erythromycin esterase-like protein
MGFDVLAFEAGLFGCDRTNEMLAEGKVRDAMFASVPGVWRVGEVRPLFQYLADQAMTERPFRLAGWDLQATGGMALELGDRLAAFLDDDEAVPESARDRIRATTSAIWDGKHEPTSAERKDLEADLDRIGAAIADAQEALVTKHGAREVAFMARALDDFRRWVEWSRTPEKGKWHKLNIRDGRMADNLRWLAEEYYPDAKIVVWGATMHLMHGSQGIHENRKAFYKGCKPMGDQTWKAFQKDVYTVGFAAHHGRKGTPFWGPFDIDRAPPDSIEDVLHRYGKPLLFVDLRRRGPFHQKLQAGPLGYSRTMTAKWPTVIDGLLFTDENTPSSYVGD